MDRSFSVKYSFCPRTLDTRTPSCFFLEPSGNVKFKQIRYSLRFKDASKGGADIIWMDDIDIHVRLYVYRSIIILATCM